MVDRPIKKSDREAAQKADPAAAQSAEPQSAEPRSVPAPVKKADRKDGGPSEKGSDDRESKGRSKGRGKGRGRGKDDAPKAPMNPALMRGPKPTKKIEPEEPEEPEEETPTEEAVAEAGEGTTDEVAAEATAEATAEAETSTEAESA